MNSPSLEIGDKFTIEGWPSTYTVTEVSTSSKLTAKQREEMKRYWDWLYKDLDIEAFIHSWGNE